MKTTVVGIDLGTSNSAVAAFVEGKHQILADDRGQHLQPSIVSFGNDHKILVGNDAKAQIFSNPKRTIHSIKRLIGKKIFQNEVKKAQVLLPYSIVEGPDQNVAVDIDGHAFSPQEISSFILRHVKEIAAKRLKTDVTEAVVTVPAHFNDHQRQATKDACSLAGLEALRMINEPTAAALAYGFGKGLKETVVIYDLGGGTFDLSVLRLKDKVFEVIATAGDTFLGGDDFDDRIIDLCAEHFLKTHQIDLRKISATLPLLRMHSEKAKKKLSYAEKTDVFIPSIVQKDGAPIDLQFSLSRADFEKATHDLIQRTFGVCDEALRIAQVRPQDLDAVILVGGPTKMSVIYDAVSTYFGKNPLRDLNPDEVVAIGASIQAQTLRGKSEQKEALLLDVTPLDLGIGTVGGYTETLIQANTPIPFQSSRCFTTVKDNQEVVDIQIFQGKNRRVEASTLLGEFQFSGFKKAMAGEVTIEVVFSINSDGIVEVSAKDQETGKEQKVSVKLSSGMTQEQKSKSSKKIQEVHEVQLKGENDLSQQKVVCCLTAKGSPVYEEGLVKNLDPAASILTLVAEGHRGRQISLDSNRLEWVMTVDDFSNIPLYLKALTSKPEEFPHSIKDQIYEFRMHDGKVIYGQGSIPEDKNQGFWIEPYFSTADQHPGKIFLYASRIAEAKPIKAA